MDTNVENENTSLNHINVIETVGKEKRLKRIEKCIYAIFAIKIVSLLVGFGFTLRALNFAEESSLLSVSNALSLSGYAGILTLDALLFVLGYFIIQDLKKEKPWAWIGAIIFFVLSAGSLWTVPVSIIALINALHEDIRNTFLSKMDF